MTDFYGRCEKCGSECTTGGCTKCNNSFMASIQLPAGIEPIKNKRPDDGSNLPSVSSELEKIIKGIDEEIERACNNPFFGSGIKYYVGG